ncbi:MAG: DUF455 family protein [Myxococcales bacterium]|nr:DUF455 family protein [Myxococcales bacterium]MCB9644762.1 DUF455 family protein [Myxococcales bacterium]
MEIRDFAEQIFFADTLEGKLTNPAAALMSAPHLLPSLTDEQPGDAVDWQRPSRPPHLEIASKRKRKRIPRAESLHDPEMRARTLHAFGNHELMALEMMAWALLAFPNAPRGFRMGLVRIILDEQEHTRLYIERVQAMGAEFGDFPLNDHFWRIAPQIKDPLTWVCCMHLSLEQANLDHAPFYERVFRSFDDHGAADLMKQIFTDELMHVRFGGHWLRHYTPDGESPFENFITHLPKWCEPHRARGLEFNEDGRRRAGLDEEFIARMAEIETSPGPS